MAIAKRVLRYLQGRKVSLFAGALALVNSRIWCTRSCQQPHLAVDVIAIEWTRLQLNGPARLCMFWSSSGLRIKDKTTASKESVGRGFSMMS
jgi:hypothetical protein